MKLFMKSHTVLLVGKNADLLSFLYVELKILKLGKKRGVTQAYLQFFTISLRSLLAALVIAEGVVSVGQRRNALKVALKPCQEFRAHTAGSTLPRNRCEPARELPRQANTLPSTGPSLRGRSGRPSLPLEESSCYHSLLPFPRRYPSASQPHCSGEVHLQRHG